MPTKYTGLRNKLQRFNDSSSYGQQIAVAKTRLQSEFGKPEIAEQIKHLSERKKKLEKIEKRISFLMTACEKALAETLEVTGEESFKLSSGGSFFLQDKIHPTVKDKLALRNWAISNGLENELGLHHKTLEGIVGDALVNGRPVPDGVEVFLDLRIGTRNLTTKDE